MIFFGLASLRIGASLSQSVGFLQASDGGNTEVVAARRVPLEAAIDVELRVVRRRAGTSGMVIFPEALTDVRANGYREQCANEARRFSPQTGWGETEELFSGTNVALASDAPLLSSLSMNNAGQGVVAWRQWDGTRGAERRLRAGPVSGPAGATAKRAGVLP